MRIKIVGRMTPEELCTRLLVILKEQGFTECHGANLYVGHDQKVVELDGNRTVVPAKKGSWKKQPKASTKPTKSKPYQDSWEPRMGAIQPPDFQLSKDDVLPF